MSSLSHRCALPQAGAEHVGVKIDLDENRISMIVASNELQDAMKKVVKAMQAAEKATLAGETIPDPFQIKIQPKSK